MCPFFRLYLVYISSYRHDRLGVFNCQESISITCAVLSYLASYLGCATPKLFHVRHHLIHIKSSITVDMVSLGSDLIGKFKIERRGTLSEKV